MRKGIPLGIITLTLLTMCTVTMGSQTVSVCDEETVEQAKARFRRLQEVRKRQLDDISNEEFRDAAKSYIFEAELCYQVRYRMGVPTAQKIDDGGLWVASSTFGNSAPMFTDDFSYPQYNLHGTKWGAGSPFSRIGNNRDAQGPRTSGGEVTYSFMGNGVSMSNESSSAGSNTAIASLEAFEPCFYQEISDAFGAWSAVANITFSGDSPSCAASSDLAHECLFLLT